MHIILCYECDILQVITQVEAQPTVNVNFTTNIKHR